VAERTNGTGVRGLQWHSLGGNGRAKGGHRRGAGGLKTEAEGEKIGWGSDGACHM
jgi:hypothetical protein